MADTATSPGAKATAKPKPSAPRRTSSNPKTLDMVVEAITALNDRKGASVPAIKNYILEKYQTVDPNMLKFRLKKALEKGLESGVVSRPKTSEQTGASLNGRFRIDKAKLAAEQKAAKPKPKPKASGTKPKKTVTKKKEPKSPKKSPAKAKKASPKVKETVKAKSAKSPKAKSSKEKTDAKPKKAAKSVDKKSTTKDKPKKPKVKKLEKSPKKVIKSKK